MAIVKQDGWIQSNKADVSELDKVPAFYSDLQILYHWIVGIICPL